MAYIMVHPGECVLEKNVNSAVGGGLLIALLPHFCCSVTQSCMTLRDPMDCSTPGLPVHHQLPELAQTQVH